MQSKAQLNSMREAHKGVHEKRLDASDANSCGPISCSEKVENYEKNHSQTVNHNELGCVEAQISNKVSGASGTTDMVLRDPLSIESLEGFGCLTHDLQETTHSRFGFQCEGHGFNLKRNEPSKVTEAKNSDRNLLGPAKKRGVGNIRQIQYRNKSVGACPAENALASSIETSTKVPPSSFQFYVREEEGINLYIDLNSSPSDWINSMKNEVCICQKVQNNESRGLHQELRSLGDSGEQVKTSFPWNTESNFQMEGGPICSGSSPSAFVRGSGHVGADYPDATNRLLMSSSIAPCNTPLKIAVQLGDDRVLSYSSRHNSDEQNLMVTGIESCLMDGETVTFDTDIPDTSQIKSTYNSLINSKSGPKWPNSLEHPSSKFGSSRSESYKIGCIRTCNVSLKSAPLLSREICEDSTPPNAGSLMKPGVICPGCSTCGSLDMQFSEVASHCKDASDLACKNGDQLDMLDPIHNIEREHGGSTNCELNQETCMDPSSACSE